MNSAPRNIGVQIPNKASDPAGDVEKPERKLPKWKRLYDVKGAPPSPRSGHCAVVNNNCMYIFGGRDGNTFKSDVYSFDFATHTWAEVQTTGARPVPRYGHKAVAYLDKMVVFGGHASTSYLNELHTLDLETNKWEKIEGLGQPPTPRWQHSMVIWRGLLIVFGGCDSTSYLNDLYSFDFERSLWSPILVDDYSIPPTPRMMHGAQMVGEKMLVFGGQGVDSIKNDLFEFNFDTSAWNFIGLAEGGNRRNFPCLQIAGNFLVIGGYSIGLRNDVLQFDFETGTWMTVDAQGKIPSPRSGQTAVLYDERVYMFGGVANDGAQNELHVMSLGYLAEATSSGPRVGSFTNDLDMMSPLSSRFAGTSPIEFNYLNRFKPSSVPDKDKELLSNFHKEESPLLLLYREEIQKLKSELEEYRRENFELKRELTALKAEKTEDSSQFLLY